FSSYARQRPPRSPLFPYTTLFRSALAPEELTGYLEAGASCLEASWGEALGAAGVELTGPDVAVYTVDALPEDSACAPVRFSEATPVVCQAENTMYSPAAVATGCPDTDAKQVPQVYMRP